MYEIDPEDYYDASEYNSHERDDDYSVYEENQIFLDRECEDEMCDEHQRDLDYDDDRDLGYDDDYSYMQSAYD